jgi:hypothetical protein
MNRVDLKSQDESAKKQSLAVRAGNQKRVSVSGQQILKRECGVSAAGRSRRLRPNRENPDFSLIRDVQMRANGANIHAVAQKLQIYVSAIECGSMLQAETVELQLRAFLAAAR